MMHSRALLTPGIVFAFLWARYTIPENTIRLRAFRKQAQKEQV